MAVYTALSRDEIVTLLAHYDVGDLLSFTGIAEGVENTNYLLFTSQGNYILTLYEQRVNPADLPFFLGLTEWLADRGIVCPRPMRSRSGEAVNCIKNKPAALITFLEGRNNPAITPLHVSKLGNMAAKMHLAAQDFPLARANALGLAGWRSLFERFAARADEIAPGLMRELTEALDDMEAHWPHELPSGIVHADLFPDNVFFESVHGAPVLSGIIDFYFACHDSWMYDLVVCLNAWCFSDSHQFLPERAQALFAGYEQIRRLTEQEKAAMPVLARGAAMRFLVTRAYDWLNRVEGALVKVKDPMEYVQKLRFHQKMADYKEYGLS